MLAGPPPCFPAAVCLIRAAQSVCTHSCHVNVILKDFEKCFPVSDRDGNHRWLNVADRLSCSTTKPRVDGEEEQQQLYFEDLTNDTVCYKPHNFTTNVYFVLYSSPCQLEGGKSLTPWVLQPGPWSFAVVTGKSGCTQQPEANPSPVFHPIIICPRIMSWTDKDKHNE